MKQNDLSSEALNIDDQKLRDSILQDHVLKASQARACKLLKTGLNAGDRYPEVWIRDLATFIELACREGNPAEIRRSLLLFFDFQRPDGAMIDGYTSKQASVDAYNYIRCEKHPGLVAHKNTVETDQESSLVQAFSRYIARTGDNAILSEHIDGIPVFERLRIALEWVYSDRWSTSHGLAWNGTTIDWGDVQPEHDWGVELDENSHPAICIYTNAMLGIALDDYARIAERLGLESGIWRERRTELNKNIRRHLWDAKRGKFRPHVYLEKGSPFSPEMKEEEIFYHGGTGIAMLAGLLSKEEAQTCYRRMQRNVAEAGTRTVGMTIWPLYKSPPARNPNYRVPFEYQNGGDWPWWGGRIAQGLLANGLPQASYEAIRSIADMVEQNDGFYEWHGPDGAPHGSSTFRGAAGAVGLAIERLWKWASESER